MMGLCAITSFTYCTNPFASVVAFDFYFLAAFFQFWITHISAPHPCFLHKPPLLPLTMNLHLPSTSVECTWGCCALEIFAPWRPCVCYGLGGSNIGLFWHTRIAPVPQTMLASNNSVACCDIMPHTVLVPWLTPSTGWEVQTSFAMEHATPFYYKKFAVVGLVICCPSLAVANDAWIVAQKCLPSSASCTCITPS